MAKIKNAGISIIIPVYNAELFIETCLYSLVNQTYKDLEIICIDSCSTDKSLEIIKNFAKKDNRIKIIEEKENKGAGYNRNLGISLATKEYIGFVDADDFADYDFYERLYDNAQIYNADVVMGETSIMNYHTGELILRHNYNFACEYCFGKKFKLLKEGTCWDKIYRAEFIRQNPDLRFPEGVLHEDNLFVLKVIYNCNKLITVPGSYYYWIRNSQSVCFKKENKDRKISDAFIVMEKIVDYIKEIKINESDKSFVVKFMFDKFASAALNDNRYKDKMIKMFKEVAPQINFVF